MPAGPQEELEPFEQIDVGRPIQVVQGEESRGERAEPDAAGASGGQLAGDHLFNALAGPGAGEVQVHRRPAPAGQGFGRQAADQATEQRGLA